jgi:lipoic acid synthetase
MRFVEPATFAAYEQAALEMGFLYAASGPLVRSSYRAAEVFLRSLLGRGEAEGQPHDPKWVDAMLSERVERARREAARVTAELGEGAPQPPIGDLSAGAGLLPATSLVRRA